VSNDSSSTSPGSLDMRCRPAESIGKGSDSLRSCWRPHTCDIQGAGGEADRQQRGLCERGVCGEADRNATLVQGTDRSAVTPPAALCG
jgi:hypothetical protein